MAADLEGCVNEHFGDVVVAREQARKKAIERVKAFDCVVVNVDQARLVAQAEFEGVALLDADNVALGSFERIVDHPNQRFGFSRTFMSYNQFNHMKSVLHLSLKYKFVNKAFRACPA